MTDDFIENWSTQPIVDVKAVDDAKCPSGYERLLSDSWQGTIDGCYCPSSGDLDSGDCDDLIDNVLDIFRQEDDCQDVRGTNPLPLVYLFGKNICV